MHYLRIEKSANTRNTERPPGMSNRSCRDTHSEKPVNLPIARVHVDERGAMQVTLESREIPPPGLASKWNRSRFGELLNALSEHRTRTVRVEVHDYDGALFTDLVHATRTEHVANGAPPPSS